MRGDINCRGTMRCEDVIQEYRKNQKRFHAGSTTTYKPHVPTHVMSTHKTTATLYKNGWCSLGWVCSTTDMARTFQTLNCMGVHENSNQCYNA